ncbi:DUF4179 domain-containing protein [Gracilibacillus thailandensis]|uniref:DUF4179 domain-containing protein n=1 Tax=Gracilibacillus thailandensis TaxID=563735 RepID=A0A6N7R216_9BACI|nr:DUF4179 domain-containing protein [Gracilibacillus thailandensis]MRI66569.1 DUF4179 domain-containing protein [Gracilibacillus thailandensis]
MSSVKKEIQKEKQQLASLHAPKHLEDRLRAALEREDSKKYNRTNVIWKFAVAIIFFSILISYSYQGLAYYGKKIIGFDNVDVISDTLQDLNEMGNGQSINESITLESGVIFTVNGVMVDDNQFILYYTVTSESNNLDDPELDYTPIKLSGFLTNSHMDSGAANLSEDKSTVKGTYSFEPPNGFAKELTLHFQMSDKTLTFDYDPNKAMGASFKQRIGQRMDYDNGYVDFETITASPTTTVIRGSTTKEMIDQNLFDQLELVADGNKIEPMGSDYSSKWTGGYQFEIRYDALTTDVSHLEISSNVSEERIEIIAD